MTKLRIGSLFSGIGGIELGLELALSAEVVWQVEFDELARLVLAKHWPTVDRSVTDVQEAYGMASLKKLTQEQADESVRLYDSGESLATVATRLPLRPGPCCR